ncbi:MAG: GHKL domain-containing protein, partial [Actinobacteria bacterium]|nr:GHKL domain-containing protein [Actinomycetota bacterium]
DERGLKQVLFNLLSNATKFTRDNGSIKVEAKKDAHSVVICVSDTGIGIDPIYHGKVFESFFQIKGSALDKSAGTGLGLSIVKQIIEKHGGKIWLESEGLNKGSNFIFTIPIRT